MLGRTLAHYTIVEKLGEGGMGVVYKARDAHLDRFVALKVLPPHATADPNRKKRFVQEAKAASALNHAGIIHIYDVASSEELDFIVMEHVSGQTLDRLIGRKGLRLPDALGYAVQIADALAKAHAAGIVHRDLKPSNVMVNDDGVVKILDFGLAKLTEREPDDEVAAADTASLRDDKPRTEEGIVVGTVFYMSPEQAQGRPVDARTDIFSFGALLYEMITGRRAFEAGSRAMTLSAVLLGDPKPLSDLAPDVPQEVERVVSRCLRKDPQRRWQTMSDLKVALQDLKEDSDSGKLHASATAAVTAPRRRRRIATALAGATVGIAALAAGAYWWQTRRPPPPLELELTRFTWETSVALSPTLSADGLMAAYASDRGGDGNLDVWVQQMAGGQPVRRTHDEADDWQPSLSPDAARIAFHSSRAGGGLYMMDTLGGEERLVASGGLVPRFSPDGRALAFARLTGGSFTLWVMPAEGGEARALAPELALGFETGTGVRPVWSPDGQILLVSATRQRDPGSKGWYAVPLDGGRAIAMGTAHALGSPSVVQTPLAWFGDQLYFCSGTTVEGINLFRIRVDRKSMRLAGRPQRLTSGPGVKADLGVARDGRALFANTAWMTSLWSLALDPTTGAASGQPQRLATDATLKMNPSLSRDGAWLAYDVYAGGHAPPRMEVRLRDMRSGQERSLALQRLPFGASPRLSADGALLAYHSQVDGKQATRVVSLADQTDRLLCEDCSVASFSADARRALVRKDRRFVWQDLVTGQEEPLLSVSRGALTGAALSADDRWVALMIGEASGQTSIRVVRIGGQPMPEDEWLTAASEHGLLGWPRWSADGRTLYYLSDRDGHACIWAQRFAPTDGALAGPSFAVQHHHAVRQQMSAPRGYARITVGRNIMVYNLAEISGNIWMTRLDVN